MAKIIAYAPNGQAYQCDSMREAKLVQGGFKFKKRKNGCGCGGACTLTIRVRICGRSGSGSTSGAIPLNVGANTITMYSQFHVFLWGTCTSTGPVTSTFSIRYGTTGATADPLLYTVVGATGATGRSACVVEYSVTGGTIGIGNTGVSSSATSSANPNIAITAATSSWGHDGTGTEGGEWRGFGV